MEDIRRQSSYMIRRGELNDGPTSPWNLCQICTTAKYSQETVFWYLKMRIEEKSEARRFIINENSR